MIDKKEIIVNPTKWERFRLRTMILGGVVVMSLFLTEVFKAKAEYPILYFMLVVTIVYSCLRLLHEWIHYFYIIVPKSTLPKTTYTVDIFTTFCKGEPYPMIEETLLAIKNITYSHQSYLCDESDDPYLKELCQELGIFHVTRIDKKNAKAGNINNALQISSGELCVILDPDHVPQPNFLDPIVAHFDNEEIGFVQVVQAYKNYDESLIAKGAAQQTFQFYGPIMMTMNKYGTVLAIGANCTFRRKALDSIGGHAAGLAEDMNTAMHLHAKGWKSIYVPQILARGLVPSTISAYYSQQLKWSRGVFELLVTSYPKLFRQFTWQQKIHYGIIPLYYLSGIIFLINFLIPILSLAFNTSPITLDFLYFMLYAGPLAALSFLIRLFVQRWVMEEEERGFHVVGGLLMIGTWWIFLMGLFYTILRKKIPYIPTPKDNNEETNWKINLPNIIIILASIASIFYGLYMDWNPYNLIMSGFAMLNCLILSFSIYASRQAFFRSLRKQSDALNTSITIISTFKKKFWLLRRFLYRQVRNTALSLSIIITGVMILISVKGQFAQEIVTLNHYNKNILIPGIFSPTSTNGLSSVKNIMSIEKTNDINFGIVSLYLPWGDAENCKFPNAVVDSIYKIGAIPMITWEPWQVLFKSANTKNPEVVENNVFNRILAHEYDGYLEKFAGEIKTLNKPIFIRFAHEADNPQYPWSAKGQNKPKEFIEAWKYLHNFFTERNLNKVIWVWNPWKPEAVNKYFPGKAYVDWLGVTNLNYTDKNNASYSMEQLYQPFHRNPIFRSGLPVMLSEMGSLQNAKQQEEWFSAAHRSIVSQFKEIKAFVLFNSKFDLNVPEGFEYDSLNWKIQNFKSLDGLMNPSHKRNHWLESDQTAENSVEQFTKEKNLAFLENIKGVNYKKGQNWSSNGLVLKKTIIAADMAKIKNMGCNTIKIFGSSIYDNNILEVANEKNLKVVFSFWLPENVSFVSDIVEMNNYTEKILSKVKHLKKDNNIIMWNLGNSPLNSLRYKNYKPDLLTEQQAYFAWLSGLIKKINEIDGKRPISLDNYVDEYFSEDYRLLLNEVPGIDCVGLVESKSPTKGTINLKGPAFMSSISPKSYLEKYSATKGVFLSDWQDEKTTNYVSLNGLIDNTGKPKVDYYKLSNEWNNKAIRVTLPHVKILVPAETTWPNTVVTYHVLISDGQKWSLVNDKKYRFRWELIKFDQFENPIAVTQIGNENYAKITIPQNPLRYKLRLYVVGDSVVKIVQSNLSLPFQIPPRIN